MVKAAFRKAGIIQVDDIEELFDTIKIFSTCPSPRGNGLAMITNGAGPCVMASDAACELGVKLSKYSNETWKKLEKNLPSYALIGNPVDLTGSATLRDYMTASRILLEDPNVNVLALFFVFQDTPLEDEIVFEVPKLREYGKPIVALASGGPYTAKQVRRLQEGGIPVFPTPERLIRAVRNFMVYYSKFKKNFKEII